MRICSRVRHLQLKFLLNSTAYVGGVTSALPSTCSASALFADGTCSKGITAQIKNLHGRYLALQNPTRTGTRRFTPTAFFAVYSGYLTKLLRTRARCGKLPVLYRIN